MKRIAILFCAAMLCGTFGLKAEEPADSLTFPGYSELDELVIEAEVPLVQTDGAKLTYNVEEDPSAGASNALDMLKKVPHVTVDGEGNVRLNGSDAFKFQVNGLDNPMLKQYGAQIFKAMPASMIVKIEVITEPGAKEDAEGTAGIINIITERSQKDDGYSGNLSLQVGNRQLTPSVYGIMKKDKVTLSANLNYQWGFLSQKGENESTIYYKETSVPTTLRSTTGQNAKHHYLGGNLNFSWEPNPDNLFTAGADLFYLDANLSSLYGTTAMYAADSDRLLWSFRQDGSGSLKMLTVSANASFRHNFGHEGNHIVLSYLFNFGRNGLEMERLYKDFVNYSAPRPYAYDESKTYNRGHTVQIDYANDFSSEKHLMEVGGKGIFRRNGALAFVGDGTSHVEMLQNIDRQQDILQPQDILAAYASYTGKYDRLGLVAGLRYEHTRMGITDYMQASQSFISRLNDWVPNAALTWNFSNSSNLRLAYQMRISRPSIEQVNPFQLSFTPYETRQGNPDLTSERSHIVSLKYSAFGRLGGGTIGLEYNMADNAIAPYTYIREANGLNTLVTSYANVGKRRTGAMTGFAAVNIIPGMTLSANGRLEYISLRSPAEGYSNHGWGGNVGANWNYTVADVNKFSVYGGWNSRNITLQGHYSGWYYYGLSVARDFLADKSLTLSLNANNFLQGEMRFRNFSTTRQSDYSSVGRSFSMWSVGFSVSWKFGSLNARVKNTGVEVKNDDISSSSNKSQGSSL